mmetsp:Transcript_10199/g.24344  ORF Transcript_10199/g.24344 Transcript_10199/m.24344 type:complete len:210 (-) Transcript_10199:180-809(-)|eukprot:scaffold34551_cov73-Phaeocystis_antarctica.AAC.2
MLTLVQAGAPCSSACCSRRRFSPRWPWNSTHHSLTPQPTCASASSAGSSLNSDPSMSILTVATRTPAQSTCRRRKSSRSKTTTGTYERLVRPAMPSSMVAPVSRPPPCTASGTELFVRPTAAVTMVTRCPCVARMVASFWSRLAWRGLGSKPMAQTRDARSNTRLNERTSVAPAKRCGSKSFKSCTPVFEPRSMYSCLQPAASGNFEWP